MNTQNKEIKVETKTQHIDAETNLECTCSCNREYHQSIGLSDVFIFFIKLYVFASCFSMLGFLFRDTDANQLLAFLASTIVFALVFCALCKLLSSLMMAALNLTRYIRATGDKQDI